MSKDFYLVCIMIVHIDLTEYYLNWRLLVHSMYGSWLLEDNPQWFKCPELRNSMTDRNVGCNYKVQSHWGVVLLYPSYTKAVTYTMWTLCAHAKPQKPDSWMPAVLINPGQFCPGLSPKPSLYPSISGGSGRVANIFPEILRTMKKILVTVFTLWG